MKRIHISVVIVLLCLGGWMEGVAMGFEIKSAVFEENGVIPKKYTCDGEDFSPPLEWTNPPAGTKGFALISDDPDAPVGTWVHWVIYDLPSGMEKLPEGIPAD